MQISKVTHSSYILLLWEIECVLPIADVGMLSLIIATIDLFYTQKKLTSMTSPSNK